MHRVLLTAGMLLMITALSACGHKIIDQWRLERNESSPPPLGGPPISELTYVPRDFSDKVYFDLDSSALTAEAQTNLQREATWLKNYNVRAQIEGHADERGTREYNLALGERRAHAVRNYLVSLGVPVDHLTVISYGKERPAVAGSNESAWAQNRRAVTVPAVRAS